MYLYVDDKPITLDGYYFDDQLIDAVFVSLFTWKRAKIGDELLNGNKFGWWGDCLSDNKLDNIGSRLWKFLRTTITNTTVREIEQITIEALTWLYDIGATDVQAHASRNGQNRIDLLITITIDNRTRKFNFGDLLNNGI